MYDFLYRVGEFVLGKHPGISTHNRHSPSYDQNGSNKFDYIRNADKLKALFKEANEMNSPSNTRKISIKEKMAKFKVLHGNLMENIKRIGSLKSLELIHMTAILGLLPLEFSMFASLEGKNAEQRGSNKFIRCCTNLPNVEKSADNQSDQNKIFNKLCDEIKSVYGSTIRGMSKCTPAKLENTLCEMFRVVKEYTQKVYGTDVDPTAKHIEECFSSANRDVSYSLMKKVDVAYIYRDRSEFFPLQNFFKVNANFNSFRIQMFAHEIRNDSHHIHKIHVTNYGQNNGVRKMNDLMVWKVLGPDFGQCYLSIEPTLSQFYMPRTTKIERQEPYERNNRSSNWCKVEAIHERPYVEFTDPQHHYNVVGPLLQYSFRSPRKYWTKKMSDLHMMKQKVLSSMKSPHFVKRVKSSKTVRKRKNKDNTNTKKRRRKDSSLATI